MNRFGAGFQPVVLMAVVVLAGLIGCGVTTSTSRCENADCRVTLSGSGADVELDTQGIAIVLEDVGDDAATLAVVGLDGGPDETVELAVGERGEVLGRTLTLERIEDGEVTLRLGPS